MTVDLSVQISDQTINGLAQTTLEVIGAVGDGFSEGWDGVVPAGLVREGLRDQGRLVRELNAVALFGGRVLGRWGNAASIGGRCSLSGPVDGIRIAGSHPWIECNI